jgi:truncated hemoglobin YjbI
MPKTLTFNMNEFKTSKSFSNVYGNHVDELKERLDLFVNHPEWYAERGIPHSLGIMLHGIPGAGKTSTIKAIAKDTHRHIFNLSLRAFTTQKQLLNLFFNESVVVHKYDGSKTTYNIPINRRVYVIEDIDCMTDVTLDRTLIQTHGQSAQTQPQEGAGDAVTLSFLLNLLDGVLETPGRILVITSNYPEKLDKALVRPGRIDVKIEFKNASREFIREMVERFYSKPVALETIPPELDNIFTPAEVMESLCTYFKDADGAIKHMLQKRPKPPQKPCLKVQEFTTSSFELITAPISTSTQNPLQKDKEQDTGTTLESLGILNSQPQPDEKPKNELVDTQPLQKTKSIVEMRNLEGDILAESMACNALTKPPPDSFLNAGIIVDEKEFTNRFQYALDGKQMDASRAFTVNPEFIPDTSQIGAYDVQGNNPSMWSDPNAESECINPDSAECQALIAKKNVDLQIFLGIQGSKQVLFEK